MRTKKLLFTLFILSMFGFITACDDNTSSNNNNNTTNNVNNTNAVCGDGEITGTETCDGTDLGEATCESEGFAAGELACGDDCALDTSGCCDDGCDDGTIVCDVDTLRTCTLNTDTGCNEWVDYDCTADGLTCGEVGGVAQCTSGCSNICNAAGDTQCSGDVVQTCATQTDGCLDWQDTTDCAANTPAQICVVDGGTNVASCADDCTDLCTNDGEERCNGDVIQTCETQSNGCLDWSDTTDCAANTPSEMCVQDATSVSCFLNGSGDSCADVMLVNLPFSIDGTDFASDYADSMNVFSNTGCDHYSSTTSDVVFQVHLAADSTLLISEHENPGVDAIFRIMDSCDASTLTCLDYFDDLYGDTDIFVAPADGDYFIMMEAYSSTNEHGAYHITLNIVDATETGCGDGVDNDNDGDIDCSDSDCFGEATFCGTEAICDDGLDNDNDGSIDCADSDCDGVGYCTTEDSSSTCTDGEDNDGDGDVDCDDSDCDAIPACFPKKGIYQQFPANSGLPFEGYRLTFTPDGNGDYTYTLTTDATFFVSPGTSTSATSLASVDDHIYNISLPFTFDFYGVSYSELWADSNGYVSFADKSYSATETVSTFFSYPIIAVAWDDLSYITGGEDFWVDSGNDGTRDWWAFTWQNREFGNSAHHLSAQLVLFDDGTIRIDYVECSIGDAIVGISSPGIDPVPAETRFFMNQGDLIFTEIMYNPTAVGDTFGEYVEVYNTTDATIDLGTCEISDNSANTIAVGSIALAPHDYIVFAATTDSTTNGGIVGAQPLTGVSLNNGTFGAGGDTVNITCNGVLVNSVTYTNSYSSGSSIQLDPSKYDGALNGDLANWCSTVDTATPVQYGDGDYGTPGVDNQLCFVTLLEEHFDSDPGWTIEDGSSDGYTWEYNASGYYTADSDAAGSGVHMVEGLVTPVIDCTGYTFVSLSYMYDYNNSWSDSFAVQVTTDGTTWNDIVTYSSDTAGFESDSYDVSAYAAGQATVQFRFLYDDNSSWAWDANVDDVVVTAK